MRTSPNTVPLLSELNPAEDDPNAMPTNTNRNLRPTDRETFQATARLPRPSEQAIAEHVGEKSFDRGRRYCQSGAIFAARRQGPSLKARCQGVNVPFYRVQTRFKGRWIAEASCNCPVGSSGRCKHVAALLLTWRESPELFLEVEELDAALSRRSRRELVVLVRQMLRQAPELEELLDTPLPTGEKTSGARASAHLYQLQAASAFNRARFEWGCGAEIAAQLAAIQQIGEEFGEQGDFDSAAAVFEGVLTALCENGEALRWDEGGEIALVVQQCVGGLACSLAEPLEDEPRRSILRTLHQVFLFDLQLGGISLADEVPQLLLERVTTEEKPLVAGWIREALQGTVPSWTRECLGRLLLDLEREALSDDEVLRLCRETGRQGDLVEKLLQLGRVDEAAAEAEQTKAFELPALADLFLRAGHGERAEEILLTRVSSDPSDGVLRWLQESYARRGIASAALEIAERRFRLSPTLGLYRQIRGLAGQIGQWEPVRNELIHFLRKSSRLSLLVQVHLEEGQLDAALHAMEEGGGCAAELELEVARAAESKRPEAALSIHLRRAEELIALRGRENYRQACQYLKTVRLLYRKLGQNHVWRHQLERLRQDHRKLRALRDELDLAGL